ncbi:MAG: ATP-binding cassette domain-containing protein, partial [Albidovulum sp.]|uniref:ATP-binding cassette domain-containing protein n=1 Tax=Albidovulum sp. TaxID=1872424 RepID=UPI003C9077CD
DVSRAWQKNDQALLSMLRARCVTYLPQRDGLLEFLTIRENILCSAELAGALPVNEIDLLITMLDLDEVLDALPAGLSGGQRQRAAVACALAQRPALILADEPTAALDAENASRVMESLIRLADRSGAAIILATHQLHLVTTYAFNKIIVTETGPKSNRRSVFETA